MNGQPDDLPTRLTLIRERIAVAAQRAGRAPDEVTLIGVVKTVDVDRIRRALNAGLTDVGENRVQAAEQAIAALGPVAARWHLIGHLQGNKSARALEAFDCIHTVDSLLLARLLSRKAEERHRILPALVQVNVSGEASKHGIEPSGLIELLHRMRECPGLRVDGLMSIGSPAGRPGEVRREFAMLRELRDSAASALGVPMPHLSMGMSDDFEVAVGYTVPVLPVSSLHRPAWHCCAR